MLIRLACVLLSVWLGGCATVAGGAGGFPERSDAFQQVQSASGLDVELRHPPGAALYPAQAHHLWANLVAMPVTQRSMGPRLLLSWFLRGVLAQGERVAYPQCSTVSTPSAPWSWCVRMATSSRPSRASPFSAWAL